MLAGITTIPWVICLIPATSHALEILFRFAGDKMPCPSIEQVDIAACEFDF